MSINQSVRSLGGAARITKLNEVGHSRYAIEHAVARGEVLRPRRGWLTLPELEPALLFAVRHGVVLSCATAAQRYQLWVPRDPELPHVAARRRGQHINAQAHIHWAAPLVLRNPDSLIDSLHNTLGLVAHCLPYEEALAVWESALNKGLTDLHNLQTLPLSAQARSLLEECRPYSDSGLETLFRTRLKWLHVSIRAQTWLFGHRVDFLIGDRLVVQIDGKQHGGAQKISDYEHDALLRLRGFTVLRFAYTHVVHDWPSVQEAIMEAIAKRQHFVAMRVA